MANPILPGISEAEQELLYKKLNEYNQGRTSYKEAGAYLVVLPHPESPRYSLWVYSPLPERQSIFTSRTFLQTSMKVCERQAAYVIILHVAFCW